MKTKWANQAGFRLTLFGIVVIFGSAALSAHGGVLAHWRMEAQSSVTCGFNGVTDAATASGNGTKTGGCGAAGATNDALITFNDNGNTVSISSTVPPAGMFNTGFSGGSGSYNAEAILNKNGALFFPQDQYGDEFSSTSWTFEMLIKANGNQSANGIQQLLKNDENNINYGLVLNESTAGGLRLFIYNGSSFPSVDLTDRNYADGQWHYIACCYDQPAKKLTIWVRSENGLVSSNSATLSIDPVVGSAGNLFLGRDTFNNGASPRTFRGLMDEVRISDSVLAEGSLLGLIKGNSTNVISSSANPALPGVSITFTSVVSAVVSGNGTPTGAVQFKTNGVAVGSPAALTSGVATISTAMLPAGLHTVSAVYPGDGKFYGSTNSVMQLVNTPPVARAVTTSVAQGGVVALPFDLGKYKLATDADSGDTLTITSVGTPNTLDYGLAGTTGASISYTNTSGSAGAWDVFSFIVTDSRGGIATNTVSVHIDSPQGYNRLGPPDIIGPGIVALTFLGIPGGQYALDHATSLALPITWTPVITNTTATNGWLRFTNTSAAPENYFRTRHVAP